MLNETTINEISGLVKNAFTNRRTAKETLNEIEQRFNMAMESAKLET